MLQLILYEISNISLSQRYVIGSYTPATYELHYFEELIFLISQCRIRLHIGLERPKYESDLLMCKYNY